MATTGENGEHERRPVPTPAEVFPPHRKRPPSRPPSRPEPGQPPEREREGEGEGRREGQGEGQGESQGSGPRQPADGEQAGGERPPNAGE